MGVVWVNVVRLGVVTGGLVPCCLLLCIVAKSGGEGYEDEVVVRGGEVVVGVGGC